MQDTPGSIYLDAKITLICVCDYRKDHILLLTLRYE
jgi:hypothetical protein